MFSIKNVKISVKLEDISLNSVVKYLECNSISFVIKGNYLVIHHKYVYIFFKLKNFVIRHINVTKIPDEESVKDSILVLQNEILNGMYLKIFYYKIDNMTAIYDTKNNVDLLKILDKTKLSFNVRYNKEKFPGLFIKTNEGTFIIFHTGKVNLVGCKSMDRLPLLFKCLENILV
jgi:hypothetical protein